MNLLAVWFLDYHNISFLVKIFKSEPVSKVWCLGGLVMASNLHLKGTNGIRAPPQKTRKLEFLQIFAISAIFFTQFFFKIFLSLPNYKGPRGAGRESAKHLTLQDYMVNINKPRGFSPGLTTVHVVVVWGTSFWLRISTSANTLNTFWPEPRVGAVCLGGPSVGLSLAPSVSR